MSHLSKWLPSLVVAARPRERGLKPERGARIAGPGTAGLRILHRHQHRSGSGAV